MTKISSTEIVEISLNFDVSFNNSRTIKTEGQNLKLKIVREKYLILYMSNVA